MSLCFSRPFLYFWQDSFKFLSYSPMFLQPFICATCKLNILSQYSVTSNENINSFILMTEPREAPLDTSFHSGISLIPILQV